MELVNQIALTIRSYLMNHIMKLLDGLVKKGTMASNKVLELLVFGCLR